MRLSTYRIPLVNIYVYKILKLFANFLFNLVNIFAYNKYKLSQILLQKHPCIFNAFTSASTININRKFMCWYQFSVARWVIAEGCYNNQRNLHFVRNSCHSSYECMYVSTTCHSAAMALSHILMHYFCRCEGPSSTRNVLIAAPQR